MFEVIHKVIESETEARRIVAASKLEADRIVADARRQAQEIANQVNEKIRNESGQILTTAAQQAEDQKRAHIQRSASEIESQIRLDETTRQNSVAAGVQCVCGGQKQTR